MIKLIAVTSYWINTKTSIIMKSTIKKDATQYQGKPVQHASDKKQSSGDKAFDDAIDRLLKKPALSAPAK
jgi:hypothetical protein